ncbi:hypothetical protein JOE49_004744 [Paenibacillus sp. PvR133]|uniref:hypothetical protein n=1 Tax=Paenibacillus sp. PvR133 TaxID=2806598 RepID=UPI001AE8AD35|nr:hypothetical protein [Paenibacillus sp. PvR133]MBP1177492.1 hypothetical protein [Paenibacillus sp. PvR133]
MENILFSEKLKALYNAICQEGIPLSIKFQIIKIEEMAEGVTGHCQLINKPDEELYINIKIREDRINEEVISHELLHAKCIKNGYNGGISCIESNSPIEKIGSSLSNTLEHMMVYQEQDFLNIRRNSSKILEQMLALDFSEKHDLQSILNALAIFESKVRGGENYEELAIKIQKKYPIAYTIALEIFELINIEKLKTAFQFRRELIKVLKYLETIELTESQIHTIPFTKLVAIGFIPSARQLSQSVNQIFEVTYNYFNTNYIALTSRSEEQLSFFIYPTSESVKDLTLDDLFHKMRHIYMVR